jgi:predicted transcriptional regulator
MPRTGPIEIKGFFEKLAIATPVVRTTLNRLVDKRIIQREKGKLGKNGFAVISLPKAMFDAAREIIDDTKGPS